MLPLSEDQKRMDRVGTDAFVRPAEACHDQPLVIPTGAGANATGAAEEPCVSHPKPGAPLLARPLRETWGFSSEVPNRSLSFPQEPDRMRRRSKGTCFPRQITMLTQERMGGPFKPGFGLSGSVGRAFDLFKLAPPPWQTADKALGIN